MEAKLLSTNCHTPFEDDDRYFEPLGDVLMVEWFAELVASGEIRKQRRNAPGPGSNESGQRAASRLPSSYSSGSSSPRANATGGSVGIVRESSSGL